MHWLVILCISLWSGFAGSSCKRETFTSTLTEYINPCYKNDPNINKCLWKTFSNLKPYLIAGIQEIDVPSIEPLGIENLVIENEGGPYKIKAEFFNITIKGASNYSVDNIKADVTNYNIHLGVKLPKIEIRGKYDVAGKILLFPIRTKGDFWALIVGIDGAADIHGKEYKNMENVEFMNIDDVLIDFRLGNSRFRIRDSINHGNIIGQAMNQFLNKHSNDIIAEMKPAAKSAISKYFKSSLNKAFRKLPLEIWLPSMND